MFSFFKNQKALNDNILLYLTEVQQNSEFFYALMYNYIENGFTPEFHAQAKLVHKSESRADDIRYLIEKLMYQHSLLPDSRSDLFMIIEKMDRIPGICEKTIEYLLIRKTDIPAAIKNDMLLFLEASVLTAKELVKGVEQLFVKPETVQVFNRNIDAMESKCDLLEHHLMKKIFEMDINDLHKERLSRILELLADISDQAEKVSNQLAITAIKRVL